MAASKDGEVAKPAGKGTKKDKKAAKKAAKGSTADAGAPGDKGVPPEIELFSKLNLRVRCRVAACSGWDQPQWVGTHWLN